MAAERQVVLDTETTGLETREGHRIIEIGCVEMVNRRLTGNNYHQYLQPDREIDAGAAEVHGITNQMLADKPRFKEIVDDFIHYIRGAELIIHNAPFDIGFLNAELARLGDGYGTIKDYCSVVDSLVLARRRHPGQKNNLDALCGRYFIDNSHRQLHGALLDSEILADVYLALTGGQTLLSLGDDNTATGQSVSIRSVTVDHSRLVVVSASEAELLAHEEKLNQLDKSCGGTSVWRGYTVAAADL